MPCKGIFMSSQVTLLRFLMKNVIKKMQIVMLNILMNVKVQIQDFVYRIILEKFNNANHKEK